MRIIVFQDKAYRITEKQYKPIVENKDKLMKAMMADDWDLQCDLDNELYDYLMIISEISKKIGVVEHVFTF